MRIQTPDFSPTETHYSLHLPPGSAAKMTASESPADVKSYMGDLFQESRCIWQTLSSSTNRRSDRNCTIRGYSLVIYSAGKKSLLSKSNMICHVDLDGGQVSSQVALVEAALLWLLILPPLGFHWLCLAVNDFKTYTIVNPEHDDGR